MIRYLHIISTSWPNVKMGILIGWYPCYDSMMNHSIWLVDTHSITEYWWITCFDWLIPIVEWNDNSASFVLIGQERLYTYLSSPTINIGWTGLNDRCVSLDFFFATTTRTVVYSWLIYRHECFTGKYATLVRPYRCNIVHSCLYRWYLWIFLSLTRSSRV